MSGTPFKSAVLASDEIEKRLNNGELFRVGTWDLARLGRRLMT